MRRRLTKPGVVLFRYNQRSESTEQREQGFLDTLQEEFPDVSILLSLQHLGTTRESSVRRTRQTFDDYGDAITGVFCVCEPNADGCLQTLEEKELAGTIPFVGFDANPAMLAALSQEKMAGIVLQDPVGLGREAVRAAHDHLTGKTVPKQITTPHRLVTAATLKDEELNAFLYPERFTGRSFQPDEPRFIVGVIPKGLTHEFWQSVHAGAEQAAREAGDARIRFEAPVLEQDIDGQIAIVREMISDGVSAICLSPIDSHRLSEVVLESHAAGIPVVLFDSGLDAKNSPAATEAVVTYVSTDNYEAGATAARCLAAAIH